MNSYMCAEYSKTRTRTKNCAIIFEITTQGFSSFFFFFVKSRWSTCARIIHIYTHIWYKKRQFCRYHAKSCFFFVVVFFGRLHFAITHIFFSYIKCSHIYVLLLRCRATPRAVPRRVCRTCELYFKGKLKTWHKITSNITCLLG